MKFSPILTPLPLFEKVIRNPAIQETSISCPNMHTIVVHFTGGEGSSVKFRLFLLYHRPQTMTLNFHWLVGFLCLSLFRPTVAQLEAICK